MAVMLDLWNRGYSLLQEIDRHMSLDTVSDVVSRLKNVGLSRDTLIHSDMGWTYTHTGYVQHLKELGVCRSISRKGNCRDNVCMENFFGHLKSETFRQVRKKKSYTFEEVNRLVGDYIDWYNNHRIQKKTGYISPVDYRKMVIWYSICCFNELRSIHKGPFLQFFLNFRTLTVLAQKNNL